MSEMIDDYKEVRECEYKGERYAVRDNGAVLRYPKPGGRTRSGDNVWTFGKRDAKTAYMLFGTHRIHIIVAKAFLGDHDSKVYVVDHIDTNRCNNRVENLRWFTRLENALNNPITRKRIEWLCGGDIQKFIDDPSCLRTDDPKSQDLSWMRTVTPDEAKNALTNLMRWAEKKSAVANISAPSAGTTPKDNEWMYKVPQQVHFPSDAFPLPSDLRNIALPKGYENPGVEFLLKPTSETATLEDYFSVIVRGAEFSRTHWGVNDVIQAVMSPDKKAIGVAITIPGGLKRYAAYKITHEDGEFRHVFLHTCFTEEGALQRMTEAAGEKWAGPDSIDNYC